MKMLDGDDPGMVHCRVCGDWRKPPYPGYQKDAVCCEDCFDEFKWRETLCIINKPYRVRG